MSDAYIVWQNEIPVMVKPTLEGAKEWAHFSPELFREDSVVHISGPHRSDDAVVDVRKLLA